MTTDINDRSLSLEVESRDFPNGPYGIEDIRISWGDVLWAALTLGRPSLTEVFQHNRQSAYEAVFRLSMIKMALQERWRRGPRLGYTNAFLALDPSERAAINYFLGLVFCKLVASRLLSTPWLAHIDVFRDQLQLHFMRGRSRPDLVGMNSLNGEWYSFECKGRASVPSETDKVRAKEQALRLVQVSGNRCSMHIGAFSFHKNDVLKFYWRDPPPYEKEPIEFDATRYDWRHHYQPVLRLLTEYGANSENFIEPGQLYKLDDFDLRIGVHHAIADRIFSENFQEAQSVTRGPAIQTELAAGDYSADGLKVLAGPSWRKPFAQFEMY